MGNGAVIAAIISLSLFLILAVCLSIISGSEMMIKNRFNKHITELVKEHGYIVEIHVTQLDSDWDYRSPAGDFHFQRESPEDQLTIERLGILRFLVNSSEVVDYTDYIRLIFEDGFLQEFYAMADEDEEQE